MATYHCGIVLLGLTGERVHVNQFLALQGLSIVPLNDVDLGAVCGVDSVVA